jgi:hypothetical protein
MNLVDGVDERTRFVALPRDVTVPAIIRCFEAMRISRSYSLTPYPRSNQEFASKQLSSLAYAD